MVSTEDWRISWCGKLHIFGVRCVECMEKQSFSFSHRGDSWRGLDSDTGSTSLARAASLPPGFPPSSHPSHQDLVFPSGLCKLKNRAELFGTGRPSFACRVFGRGRERERRRRSGKPAAREDLEQNHRGVCRVPQHDSS